MSLKLQHLQFAKLYPSSLVTITKSVTPNQFFLGTMLERLSPYTPRTVLGFQGKSSQFVFFSFLFFFLFSYNFFLNNHWSFIQGFRTIKGGQRYQAGLLQSLEGKTAFQPINEL